MSNYNTELHFLPRARIKCGDFYINGKKYEKEFIVQVQKEKTAKNLAVFLSNNFVTESIVIGKE